MLALAAGGCASSQGPDKDPGVAKKPPQQQTALVYRPTPPPPPQTTTQGPVTNTDPCAMRLHDLCGALLLYFGLRQELPTKIEDLVAVPGFEHLANELSCPASSLPYVFNRDGLLLAEQNSLVIIYDRSPAHIGMRWGIAIDKSEPGMALVARVVILPESMFTFVPQE
jgi:hypothetical protein